MSAYSMVVYDDEHPDGFEYERFPVGHSQTLFFTKEPSAVTRIELRFHDQPSAEDEGKPPTRAEASD